MLSPRVQSWLDAVDASWVPVLASVGPELECAAQAAEAAEAAGVPVLPSARRVLRALELPLDAVRVLIVGQDPYPTPGHAIGLSFSVEASVRPLPASLRNIFRELVDDTGCPMPTSGDLSAWSDQGVMLLNRVLTVRAGEAGSMRGVGWEAVTLAIVRALAARNQPPVVVLWGADAATVASEFEERDCIQSPHPSPLAAHRGFFGSRPFTRANALLEERGQSGVNWALPA